MSNVVPFRRVERDAAAVLRAPPTDGRHLAQFYEHEDFLYEAAGLFLGAGLEGTDRLLLIATPEHRDGILGRMNRAHVDDAIASGRLLALDARETVARFMVNGAPDPERFHRTLEELLMGLTKGQPRVSVRAYGEMVDLLWRDGLRSAAVRLEELWNEAAARHSFSLLCAYTMASFYKGGDGPGFIDVCKAHSHVLPAESSAGLEALPLVDISRLEERVRSLEAENAQLRNVERALRASSSERSRDGEWRFRLLVESVKDYAIFILDPKGVVATWNAGAERIKGYGADEIVGRHFSTFYPPEDVAAGKCERELAEAVQVGRFEDEGWRVRKDGTRFWANVVITRLLDASGALVGFAKVTRDLTERIRTEQERVRLARMEEAEQRKDEFLAIMGHELRNPLAPLVTAAHMIRLRHGRATEKEMGVLDRQLRQIGKIVDDLLDASHAMRDRIVLSPVVMEIGEVLANAIDLASPRIEAARHSLVVEVPERGLAVDVDPERMAQVFGNILDNAAKYTPGGGTIRIRAARRDDEVEVSIEDDGQGIAPELIGRVFALFTQGDHGLDRAKGGLGIGLAIAQRLVHAHHGRIAAQSAGVGRGSRFTVTLPRTVSRPRELSRSEPVNAARTTAARRILIADDNRDSVEMMQALLEHCGHEIRVAFDGPDALRICEEFKPDTVFLDIGLPGMDGYEVVRRMRMIPSCAKIPIVAVSGYARAEDRARALRSGFTDHLAKPVDLDHITAMLEARV